MITLANKSHQAGIGAIVVMVLGGFASVADAQQVAVNPVTDIREA